MRYLTYSIFVLLLGAGTLQAQMLAEHSTQEEISESKQMSVQMVQQKIAELVERQDALERQYKRQLRKADRWQRKSVKILNKELESIEDYESSTEEWNENYYAQFNTLDECEALEEPVEVNKMIDLSQFIWELEDYYNLLYWRWNRTLTPPVGSSIENGNQLINSLLEKRASLLRVADPSALKALERIDQRLAIALDKQEILYKDSLRTAANASEVYRHLDFMQSMYPVITDEVDNNLKSSASITEKEILQRHFASKFLAVNSKYLGALQRAKRAHYESIDLIKPLEDAPDQIMKFQAQRLQIKELKEQLLKQVSNSAPSLEVASSE